MATIINTDTKHRQVAEIISKADNDLGWCIATWPAPKSGFDKITGEGHGWQIVRARRDGTYSYNNSMSGGYRNSLQDVKDFAASKGYTII